MRTLYGLLSALCLSVAVVPAVHAENICNSSNTAAVNAWSEFTSAINLDTSTCSYQSGPSGYHKATCWWFGYIKVEALIPVSSGTIGWGKIKHEFDDNGKIYEYKCWCGTSTSDPYCDYPPGYTLGNI